MALKIPLLGPKPIQLIPNYPANSFPTLYRGAHFTTPSRRHNPIAISCAKDSNNNSFSDGELAVRFAAEVEKLKAQSVEKEEALNKSRELLFKEFSNYMGLKAEEVKGKWRTMNEDDKLAVAKGFVSGWSDHFHPLSAKSAKELIDEHLADDREAYGDDSSSGPVLFPSLRKLIGF